MGKVPALMAEIVGENHDTFYWLQQINRASVVCNVQSGLLTPDLARQIRGALNELQTEYQSDESLQEMELYIQFEPRLLKLAGQAASVLHVGRSSQDILATCSLMKNRHALMQLSENINVLRNALVQLAQRQQEALIPAYTNGVQAQPTLYAHYLLAQYEVFSRDVARIDECVKRYSFSPMGSGVCNGTGWPLDSSRMAELLGLKAPTRNAFDAGQCQGNDLPLEASQIVTAVMLHVNAFLADFMIQYSQARPWLVLTSNNGVYMSSAMPQKRNPGLINDCRRDAGLVMAQAQSFPLRMQNLSLGMADLRDPYSTASLFADACVVVRTLAGIVDSIAVDKERALQELNSEWTCTQELADTLVRSAHVDFRSGHSFASTLVTWARTNKRSPNTVRYDEVCALWKPFAKDKNARLPSEFPLSEKEFLECLHPQHIVENRKTAGSANPQQVSSMIKQAQFEIQKKNEEYALYRQSQTNREERLEALLNAI